MLISIPLVIDKLRPFHLRGIAAPVNISAIAMSIPKHVKVVAAAFVEYSLFITWLHILISQQCKTMSATLMIDNATTLIIVCDIRTIIHRGMTPVHIERCSATTLVDDIHKHQFRVFANCLLGIFKRLCIVLLDGIGRYISIRLPFCHALHLPYVEAVAERLIRFLGEELFYGSGYLLVVLTTVGHILVGEALAQEYEVDTFSSYGKISRL